MRSTHPGEADLEQFLEDLKGLVREGQDLIRGRMNQTREGVSGTMQATDRYLREHPYPTLGVVFGVGLLLGVVATAWFMRESPEEPGP